MAVSIGLLPHQNQSVVQAVADGKTITLSSMSPGGGFVWPHILANGVPVFKGVLTRHQVQAIIDLAVAGKTAAVNFNTGVGRNHIDFT